MYFADIELLTQFARGKKVAKAQANGHGLMIRNVIGN
ncbi:MAG: hypothetical protein ACJAUG_000578 [Halioglobus sp.]|jgi:hypothetical protein